MYNLPEDLLAPVQAEGDRLFLVVDAVYLMVVCCIVQLPVESLLPDFLLGLAFIPLGIMLFLSTAQEGFGADFSISQIPIGIVLLTFCGLHTMISIGLSLIFCTFAAGEYATASVNFERVCLLTFVLLVASLALEYCTASTYLGMQAQLDSERRRFESACEGLAAAPPDRLKAAVSSLAAPLVSAFEEHSPAVHSPPPAPPSAPPPLQLLHLPPVSLPSGLPQAWIQGEVLARLRRFAEPAGGGGSAATAEEQPDDGLLVSFVVLQGWSGLQPIMGETLEVRLRPALARPARPGETASGGAAAVAADAAAAASASEASAPSSAPSGRCLACGERPRSKVLLAEVEVQTDMLNVASSSALAFEAPGTGRSLRGRLSGDLGSTGGGYDEAIVDEGFQEPDDGEECMAQVVSMSREPEHHAPRWHAPPRLSMFGECCGPRQTEAASEVCIVGRGTDVQITQAFPVMAVGV